MRRSFEPAEDTSGGFSEQWGVFQMADEYAAVECHSPVSGEEFLKRG
jgi:hypothetical protein